MGRLDARAGVTIYDVAARAGVSKSLVSLVLQGSPRVSEKRRVAVLAAIDELGYRPNQAAATLAGNRSKTIGVVIDDFRNLWFVDLLQGLRSVLDEPGFHVSVADLDLNSHLGVSPIDGFLAARVDGLVLAAEPRALPEHSMDAHRVPIVTAGSHQQAVPGADSVADDDAAGSRLAVGHLVGLGHTKIAHLSGAGAAAGLRARSYLSAMAALSLPARLINRPESTTEEAGYRGCVDLLHRYPDTTAVFAANDTMALGALAALRERGLRVPHDISLVGYDNSPLAQSRYLALTSVDARSLEVGSAAGRALLTRMERPDTPVSRHLIVPALIRRASTAPLVGG